MKLLFILQIIEIQIKFIIFGSAVIVADEIPFDS